MNPYDIPVLLIVFNRPDTTRQVLEAIKLAEPAKLYITGDGARPGKHREEQLVSQTRELLKDISWPCEVHYNYQEHNLGCGLHVSQGIDWFFLHEEKGIIMEDDCVPSPAFFPFASEMLSRYEYDSRVMHISGSRYNEERVRNDDSYFFSRYAHIWGWATWRRAWDKFDYFLKDWPECIEGHWLKEMFPSDREQKFWYTRFDKSYHASKKHAWGHQWMYCVNKNNGLCITPAKNLITNVGTVGAHNKSEMTYHFREHDDDFKVVRHPRFMVKNSWYDNYHFKNHFNLKRPLWDRVLRKLR